MVMKTRTFTDKTKATLLAAVIRRRKSRGLSVNGAAAAASITQPTWSRVEAGLIDPTFETLVSMADAVGLPVRISF